MKNSRALKIQFISAIFLLLMTPFSFAQTTPDEIAKYGLKNEDPSVLKIELTTKSGMELLYVGKVVEGDDKKIGHGTFLAFG